MSIGLVIFVCIGAGIVMSIITLKLFFQAMTKGEQQAAKAVVVAQHPNLDPSFVRTP